MLYSARKGSIFYAKNVHSKPPPSFYSIYRNYIKSSLQAFKFCDRSISLYLFKLLDRMKFRLNLQKNKVAAINQLIALVKPLSQNSDKKQPGSRLFSQPNKKISIQQQMLKLQTQKSSLQRAYTQKLLYYFQCLHYFNCVNNQSFDPSCQMEIRRKQQSKLLHLCFNISQYFTPTLHLRKKYQSLILLQNLEDDFQFEQLSEKDKQFVRNVIIKVCANKRSNHSRYFSVVEYLKDPQAVCTFFKIFQFLRQRMRKLLFKKAHGRKKEIMLKKKKNQAKKQKIFQDQKEEDQDDEQQKEFSDQWSLIGQKERNQAVKRILLNQLSERNLNDQSKSKISIQNFPKSVVLQILAKLNRLQNQKRQNCLIQQEFYIACKRLFKLSADQSKPWQEQVKEFSKGVQNNDNLAQKHALPISLKDMIIENEFVDEFVNHKRLIIV